MRLIGTMVINGRRNNKRVGEKKEVDTAKEVKIVKIEKGNDKTGKIACLTRILFE